MVRSLSVVVLVVSLLPAILVAQEKEDPKDILVGTVKLAMNSEYVVVAVDGASWDDYFFEDDGMSLFVQALDRTKDHKIVVTPIYDELKPAEVTVKPKDFKVVKLDKTTRQWRAERTIRFEKWKPGEREKWLEQKQKSAPEQGSGSAPEQGSGSAPEQGSGK